MGSLSPTRFPGEVEVGVRLVVGLLLLSKATPSRSATRPLAEYCMILIVPKIRKSKVRVVIEGTHLGVTDVHDLVRRSTVVSRTECARSAGELIYTEWRDYFLIYLKLSKNQIQA